MNCKNVSPSEKTSLFSRLWLEIGIILLHLPFRVRGVRDLELWGEEERRTNQCKEHVLCVGVFPTGSEVRNLDRIGVL